MEKNKFIGITALLPLILCNFWAVPVHAEVTEYQEADTGAEMTSAECEVIYKSAYGFSEEIPKYPELEASASGYEGVYDGKPHSITVGCKTEGTTVLYSTDGKAFTDKKPVYTDVGTYVVYYKAEKDGYATITGSATVRIKEATIDFNASDYSGTYDGKGHSIDLTARTDGCRILYSEDGVNFTTKKPEYKEPGTYTVYYKILKDNYGTVIGSCTVTIKEKDGTVSNDQGINNQNNKNQNNNSDKTTGSGIANVQTGDNSSILLYAVAFIVSALGMAKSRKRKGKRKLWI